MRGKEYQNYVAVKSFQKFLNLKDPRFFSKSIANISNR